MTETKYMKKEIEWIKDAEGQEHKIQKLVPMNEYDIQKLDEYNAEQEKWKSSSKIGLVSSSKLFHKPNELYDSHATGTLTITRTGVPATPAMLRALYLAVLIQTVMDVPEYLAHIMKMPGAIGNSLRRDLEEAYQYPRDVNANKLDEYPTSIYKAPLNLPEFKKDKA